MWEQEGALRDVQVSAHILQRETKTTQTCKQIFPTPQNPLRGVFIWNSSWISISFHFQEVGMRGERICHAWVVPTVYLTDSSLFSMGNNKKKKKKCWKEARTPWRNVNNKKMTLHTLISSALFFFWQGDPSKQKSRSEIKEFVCRNIALAFF